MIHEAKGVTFGPAHELSIPPEAVMAFYTANWERPIALSLPSYYRWQFMQPPENDGVDLNCVAARGSEILGVMGLNRRTMWLRGKAVPGVELTTWVVAGAARGLGVGGGIMKSLQGSYPLMIGLGISHAAMPIYTGAGFRHLWHIPRYFRVLDIEAVRGHAKIDTVGERLVSAWEARSSPAWRAEPAGAATLAACEPVMRKDFNLYVRDAASLAWRYECNPTYRYEGFFVRAAEGGGSGVAVIVREDHASDLRFLHVIDCFGDDRDIPAAVAFLEDMGRQRQAAFIDLYCTATAIARHFLGAGWFSTNDDYFFQLSHLFYPPEFRTPQTTSAVLWARENKADLLDFGRLYMGKGDLDLDRPTLAYYDAHRIPTE